MRLFRRRAARPSPEAVAAIEAAEREHKRAVEQLHEQVRRDPEVREAWEELEAHNAANHWQQWLFEVTTSAHRPT